MGKMTLFGENVKKGDFLTDGIYGFFTGVEKYPQ